MTHFYHMHAILSTTVSGECRTAGTPQHHTTCSQHGFTHANEVSCTLNSSTNKCKCIHDLPPGPGGRVPRGFRRVTSAKQKRKTKPKTKSTRSKKKKTTRRR